MMEEKVPLNEIFRTGRRCGIPAKRSGMEYVIATLRSRSSLSLLELDALKEVLKKAAPDYSELVQLETLVRGRIALSERQQGWHAGFGDFLKYVLSLRMQREVA